MTGLSHSTPNESWTRNAYFRACNNFSSGVVDRIELETRNANESIIELERELEKHRSAFKRRIQLSRKDKHAKSAATKDFLEDEAKLRKERLHAIYTQFPLASLDEKLECSLRISLRSRLIERLRSYEREDGHGTVEVGHRSSIRGLYVIPDKEDLPSPPSASPSSATPMPSITTMEQALHVAQFEAAMMQRSDQRELQSLEDRLQHISARLESLPSESDNIEEDHTKQLLKKELQLLKDARKSHLSKQRSHTSIMKMKVEKLKKLMDRKLKAVSSEDPVPSSTEVKSSAKVQKSITPGGSRAGESAPLVPHEGLLRQSFLASLTQCSRIQDLARVPQSVKTSLRGWETIVLGPSTPEQEQEVDSYRWPGDLENAIPHVMTAVVEPRGRRRGWEIMGSSVADSNALSESQAATVGLPGQASQVWLHIQNAGDFLAASAHFQSTRS